MIEPGYILLIGTGVLICCLFGWGCLMTDDIQTPGLIKLVRKVARVIVGLGVIYGFGLIIISLCQIGQAN